jgi:ribonuclease HII
MHRALDKLTVRPEELIIDGNKFDPYFPNADHNVLPVIKEKKVVQLGLFGDEVATKDKKTKKSRSMALEKGCLPYTTIVKGDGKYLSIAAASILAKTYRDDYMNELAEQYPQYDWLSNKGYPTKKHRMAIAEYGPTPYHRMTFALLPE